MHSTIKISLKPFPGLRVKTFSALFLLSLFTLQKPFAQVSDDFSDGDFTTDPRWHGTVDEFLINSGLQLQLNSNAAGTSWLSTDFPVAENGEITWEFFVKQSFSPSGANFGRIYLFSDAADVTQPLNGYYLQFGEAGSADAVELFRQSGTATVSVCRATAAAIAASFQVRVKVMRSGLGEWQLLIDYSGGSNFVLEATAVDHTHARGSFFGILWVYTISNATRFYFDDFSGRTATPADVTPPQVVSVEVTSLTLLEVVFSEPVDPVSAADQLHYWVEPLARHPVSATAKADGRTAELVFADAFPNGSDATLTIKDVTDIAGNAMGETRIGILFFVPVPVTSRDVIINEIFPDPTPQASLPPAEFIELFNRSGNPVQLDGWRFSDGTSTAIFPAYLLLPGKYLAVCPSPAFAEYEIFGPAIPLPNFPTLNNSADRLVLTDPEGNVIDSLSYVDTWYRDPDKASGGWTLEVIDPEDFCGEESRWIASEDPRGGTPGNQNSVFASRPDRTGPRLLSVIPDGPDRLLVAFDEKLDQRLPSTDDFEFLPSLEIISLSFTNASRISLTIILANGIEPGQSYTLKVSDIYDCPGNKIEEAFSETVFVLPEKAAPGDIIINEILFNPRTTGVDFLELYNRSEKTIDLKDWSVRNLETSAAKNATTVSDKYALMVPGEYRVLTEDPVVLKGEYVMAQETTFWQTDLPAFNNEEGSASLVDANGMIIDSIGYRAHMHSPFLKETEGVSLERISFAWPGSESANWRSASSASGFATPGFANSNLRKDEPADPGSVIVEPEIIVPGSASRDFAQIKYRFEQGGFMANVKVFDQQGRIIREIARNELLGTEGFFRWDGDRDNGATTRMGYYLVWFEIFGSDGFVKTYKKRVVIY